MTFLEPYWEQAQPVVEFCRIYFTNPVVLGALAAGVLFLLFLRIRRKRRPIVLFRSQGGNVEIARATLRGLIVGASLRVRGVETATCRYDQRGRKLRVTVSIHLAGDARLTDVEEQLKDRIRQALHTHIGYEPADVAPINVRVTKIVGDPTSLTTLPRQRRESLAETAAPLPGPTYEPLDAEEGEPVRPLVDSPEPTPRDRERES